MRPLILSGPPRSGTTLFSALLDGHSDINWFPDEGYFFEHAHRNPDFAAAAGCDLIAGIRDRGIMPPLHAPLSDFPTLKLEWSEDRFRSALSPTPPKTVRGLWDYLCNAYMCGLDYRPRRFVTMKAADYGRSVFGALAHFPEARGVIIVRDPIDALNSLKAYRLKYSRRLLTWPTLAEAVDDMNTLARHDLIDRCLVVRYEDFSGNCEPTMRALCDWLGIDFEPTLLTPSMMGVPWSNNSSFQGERAAVLTLAERKFIRQASAPFCAAFGYTTSRETL